jgi:hypothetical protein
VTTTTTAPAERIWTRADTEVIWSSGRWVRHTYATRMQMAHLHLPDGADSVLIAITASGSDRPTSRDWLRQLLLAVPAELRDDHRALAQALAPWRAWVGTYAAIPTPGPGWARDILTRHGPLPGAFFTPLDHAEGHRLLPALYWMLLDLPRIGCISALLPLVVTARPPEGHGPPCTWAVRRLVVPLGPIPGVPDTWQSRLDYLPCSSGRPLAWGTATPPTLTQLVTRSPTNVHYGPLTWAPGTGSRDLRHILAAAPAAPATPDGTPPTASLPPRVVVRPASPAATCPPVPSPYEQRLLWYSTVAYQDHRKKNEHAVDQSDKHGFLSWHYDLCDAPTSPLPHQAPDRPTPPGAGQALRVVWYDHHWNRRRETWIHQWSPWTKATYLLQNDGPDLTEAQRRLHDCLHRRTLACMTGLPSLDATTPPTAHARIAGRDKNGEMLPPQRTWKLTARCYINHYDRYQEQALG